MDAISLSRLIGSHPLIHERIAALDTQLTANGVTLRITAALRNWAQQAALYAQGRTTPGQIVTNALPGYSWHSYGLALDIVPMFPNGQPDWDIAGANWQKIYALLPGCGLFSGKDFAGRFKDDDHIQLAELPESPTANDVILLKASGIPAVWAKYFPNT